MRVGLHTWGSEGDIRPFLALAEGLVAAGHEVRLAYSAADGRDYAARLAHARFAHEDLGNPVPPDALREVASAVFADSNPIRQVDRVLRELLEPVIDNFVQSAHGLVAWADVLVTHVMAHPLVAACEVENKPVFALYTAPMTPTRTLPPPGLPNLGPLNALAWRLALRMLSSKFLPSVSRVRAGFGLPPIGRIEEQLAGTVADLVAISPTLLAQPADWPAKVQVVGFLAAPRAREPVPLEPALEAFLGAGPPPVYLTFGSMSAAERHPAQVQAAVAQALDQAQVRAIVQSDTPAASGDRVCHITRAPHEHVFPRCSVVVHHGGAGTTHSALRAGRPSVVVAHMADQFMWGRRLTVLGVAPALLTRRALKPTQLAQAITAASGSTSMAERARALSEAMAHEDGVARTIAALAGAARA